MPNDKQLHKASYIKRAAAQAVQNELLQLFNQTPSQREMVSNLSLEGSASSRPKASFHEVVCEPENASEKPSSFHVCHFLPEESEIDSNDDQATVNQEDSVRVESDQFFLQLLADKFSSDTNSDSNESTSSSESESKSDRNPSDLRNSLQMWSSQFNVTNVAITALLGILQPYHPELPKDSRTLKKTPTKTVLKELTNGQYSHIGLKAGIISKLKGGIKPGCKKIERDIFCDGVKMYNSVMAEAWPILFRCKDFVDNKPSVLGIFYGDGKPDPIEDYLADFISEMKVLREEGIRYLDSVFQVDVRFYLADAPARAYLKGTVGHTSNHGCERCDKEGDFTTFVIYSAKTGIERTDSSFDERRDPEHHKTNSPLAQLNTRFITQIPLEPMHLVDYGCSKRFLDFVISRGPPKAKMSGKDIKTFGELLKALYVFIPYEFTRKPLLRRATKWKSIEYRLMLLYLGPVIFERIWQEEVFKLYLLLHTAIFIMNSDVLIESFLSDAESFLHLFVQYSVQVFGPNFVVLNVHSLMHLSRDIKLFGNAMSFSAYPFEDKLGQIKKLVKSPNRPIQQICRKLVEKEKVQGQK